MNFHENLTNNLYNFFTCLPEHVERWDDTVKKTLGDINMVYSLAESYNDVLKSKKIFVDLAADNNEGAYVKQRNLSTLLTNLEDVMVRIKGNQDVLQSIVEELWSKHSSIEGAAAKVPDIDSADNFYNIPRLNRLREYAENATRFYQTLYLQIDTAMSNIDYMELHSIKDVLKTWDQKASSHPDIREILAFSVFANSHTSS